MLAELKKATSEAEVKEVEIKYLGRKGAFNDIMKALSSLSDEEKRTVGKEANITKGKLEGAVNKRIEELETEKLGKIADEEWMDMTVSGIKPERGHRHLISSFIEDLERIFAKMGFAYVDGKEIEEEHYNFNQLNIPDDHPARDMQDTFWLKDLPGKLLRTHTSANQIHHMEKNDPPTRIISMGKVYRKDSDATHSPMFHQVEGLMVGEHISMANLKATLTHMLRQVFEDDSIKVRFRVSYFPFVEPGLEVDCTSPRGGWLEIGGAGMVHPNVLENVGYDPNKYTGFAFGMGIDRMIMIKHGIKDLRLFFENDLRFIEQF